MDRSSGAAMAVRTMLRQLRRRGYEVAAIGATVFDAQAGVDPALMEGDAVPGTMLRHVDEGVPVTHVRTAGLSRGAMTRDDEVAYLQAFRMALREFAPDIVLTFGGTQLDMRCHHDAAEAGARVAFYLANGNYAGGIWSAVDLVLTDSHATADLYWKRCELECTPVGMFIEPGPVVADSHERRNVLFVNPMPQKGGMIVAQLAARMAETRPDIPFEVVQGRGTWLDVWLATARQLGRSPEALPNVTVTPPTRTMRDVYGRARVLLSPSLWWESASRVVVEAMMNGVPPIVTDRAGPPEMAGDAATTISLPDAFHAPPYAQLLPDDLLGELEAKLVRLYDDETHHRMMGGRALARAGEAHGLERGTDALIDALASLLPREAVPSHGIGGAG